MSIPEHIIAQVREHADIVEIIGEFVPLRQRGKSFVALCPFHQEKTPSFSVSPERGIYKCFGCGKAGNVFTFLMDYLGVSFPEAVRMVAERCGISIPEDSQKTEQQSLTDQIYRVLQHAATLYMQWLQDDVGKAAREYLARRGIHQRTIARYHLGYAPDQWDALLSNLRQHGYSDQLLIAAGLIVESADRVYDRFRHRIIYPIFHSFGKVLGFGARRLRESDEPKYLNSPQTAVYDKSRNLFGLFQAKDEIRKKGFAVIVEGYMDVLALAQAGIANVVATCGTVLTKEQFSLLKRYTTEIRILYDQDEAGQKAAERAVEQAFSAGCDVFVVQLPEGEDPDSFVQRSSVEHLQRRIDEALPGLAFLIRRFHETGQFDTPVRKARAVTHLLHLIHTMPEQLQREFALRQLAQLLHISELQLYQSYKKLSRKSEPQSRKPAAPKKPGPPSPTDQFLPEEQELLRLLVEHPQSINTLQKQGILHPELFLTPIAREIYTLLQRYAANAPGEWIHSLLEDPHVEEEKKAALTTFLLEAEMPSSNWEKFNVEVKRDPRQLFQDCLRRLQLRKLRLEQEMLLTQLREKAVSEEILLMEKLKEIQQKIRELSQ